MVDFVLHIRSNLVWDFDEFRKTNLLGGLDPLKLPGSLGAWLPRPPAGCSSPGSESFWIETP